MAIQLGALDLDKVFVVAMAVGAAIRNMNSPFPVGADLLPSTHSYSSNPKTSNREPSEDAKDLIGGRNSIGSFAGIPHEIPDFVP